MVGRTLKPGTEPESYTKLLTDRSGEAALGFLNYVRNDRNGAFGAASFRRYFSFFIPTERASAREVGEPVLRLPKEINAKRFMSALPFPGKSLRVYPSAARRKKRRSGRDDKKGTLKVSTDGKM